MSDPLQATLDLLLAEVREVKALVEGTRVPAPRRRTPTVQRVRGITPQQISALIVLTTNGGNQTAAAAALNISRAALAERLKGALAKLKTAGIEDPTAYLAARGPSPADAVSLPRDDLGTGTARRRQKAQG